MIDINLKKVFLFIGIGLLCCAFLLAVGNALSKYGRHQIPLHLMFDANDHVSETPITLMCLPTFIDQQKHPYAMTFDRTMAIYDFVSSLMFSVSIILICSVLCLFMAFIRYKKTHLGLRSSSLGLSDYWRFDTLPLRQEFIIFFSGIAFLVFLFLFFSWGWSWMTGSFRFFSYGDMNGFFDCRWIPVKGDAVK